MINVVNYNNSHNNNELQHQHGPKMSSFLMNSGGSGTYGSVVDPKFPPSEEYSQSSYIPAAADYYVPHQSQHYGYNNAAHPHQTSMGYYGQHSGHHAVHSGYYGTCGMSNISQVPMTTSLGHQQQHPSPGIQLQRSPIPSPTPSLTSVMPCNQQMHVSPLQQLHQLQQQPLHHHQMQQMHQINSIPPMNPQPMNPQNQPQPAQQPQQPQQQANNTLLCQPPTPNSPADSDLEDGGSDSDESHNPVIYPWMKKIHVAGAGQFLTISKNSNFNNRTRMFRAMFVVVCGLFEFKFIFFFKTINLHISVFGH